MSENYRIDFVGQTADNYMTFPQTEQSQKLIQRNRTVLLSNAKQAGNTIAEKSLQKAEANGPSGRVDIIV